MQRSTQPETPIAAEDFEVETFLVDVRKDGLDAISERVFPLILGMSEDINTIPKAYLIACSRFLEFAKRDNSGNFVQLVCDYQTVPETTASKEAESLLNLGAFVNFHIGDNEKAITYGALLAEVYNLKANPENNDSRIRLNVLAALTYLRLDQADEAIFFIAQATSIAGYNKVQIQDLLDACTPEQKQNFWKLIAEAQDIECKAGGNLKNTLTLLTRLVSMPLDDLAVLGIEVFKRIEAEKEISYPNQLALLFALMAVKDEVYSSLKPRDFETYQKISLVLPADLRAMLPQRSITKPEPIQTGRLFSEVTDPVERPKSPNSPRSNP